MTIATMPTIANWLKKHPVRMTATQIEKRPDNLMADSTRHFLCRLYGSGKSVRIYFSQGSANTKSPTVQEVLNCLASDSAGVEESGFEDWCNEYGYDNDSRTAERIFKACQSYVAKLKIIAGDGYESLLYETERL